MAASSEFNRVQSLVESGISKVPSQYIQLPENRPDNRTKPLIFNIPIIDLSLCNSNDSTENHQNLYNICREWGAFQIINHGVPKTLLDEMRNIGFSFFKSPFEDKLKYSCDASSSASEGYGSKMLSKDDGFLDWRDYFDHHTLPESRRNVDHWPASPPNYRDTVLKYSEKMKELAQKILSLISMGLGFRPSYIEEAVGEPYQNITISYYPPCPQPELTIGLQAHSDMGAITLLIQDEVGGLQVLKDNKWIDVEPLTDAIVVLLADQTEIISNGEYISAQHRAVVNANRARLSVSTFYDPSKNRKIGPAPELVARYSARYHEVVYGDYVSAWYSKGPEGKRNIDALKIIKSDSC